MFRLTRQPVRSHLALLAVAGSLALVPSAARASNISFLDTFGNISYEQTGNGNSLSLNGAFFSADLNSSIPNAYTSASFTPPGGSATALTQESPTDYSFQTGFFPTLAAMKATYGFGTYSFSGTNGTTDTASLSYLSDDYTTSTPFLTGTDYASLQGMNAANSFTFHFSPYTPGSNPDETDAILFFTVFDETTSTTVFNGGFLPSTTSSITAVGGTFTPGDSYDYELDYSDRDIVPGSGDTTFPPELGFDVRTDGTFTAAAATIAPTPEPNSLILLGTGAAGILGLLRRRIATSK